MYVVARAARDCAGAYGDTMRQKKPRRKHRIPRRNARMLREIVIPRICFDRFGTTKAAISIGNIRGNRFGEYTADVKVCVPKVVGFIELTLKV